MKDPEVYVEMDEQIAEQLFGWKRTTFKYIHSLAYGSYYAQSKTFGNQPLMPPEFKEEEKEDFNFNEPNMPRYSLNLDSAMLAVHSLYPDDDTFKLVIETEINEGFSGYHVTLCGVHVESERNLAYTICLACITVFKRRKLLEKSGILTR